MVRKVQMPYRSGWPSGVRAGVEESAGLAATGSGPGHVVILNEMMHNARIVPLDGRPHGNIRQWAGDSRGHWEGETLVVETTNFLPASSSPSPVETQRGVCSSLIHPVLSEDRHMTPKNPLQGPHRKQAASKVPRRVVMVVVAILGAGLLFLLSNLELPIVRNSFAYAKAARNIIDHGFNPLPVIADTQLSNGKPIGFSLLSAPFVSILGANAGVKVASFLGTAFFLGVAYFFFARMNRRVGIDSRFISLELALLFFNPLVSYQFWSAYADGLFTGLVLLAFVLVDIIVAEPERDTRRHIILLGFVIYAAILTKFYGLILGIACPAYVLLHLRSLLKDSAYLRQKMAVFLSVFGVLGVAVVLARLGSNPTLKFAVDVPFDPSGYSRYMAALTDPSAEPLLAAVLSIIVALVLNFHFSLVFLLKKGGRAAWPAAPTCFVGIYLLGLLLFPGTFRNMRFFLPAFAFVVVAIVAGMPGTKKWLGRAILIPYVGAASLLTLNYNVTAVYERLRPVNEQVLLVAGQRRLDNLRLPQHVRLSRRIERINARIEPGGVLYWASSYYGAATHDVVRELGIRDDIVVHSVYSASQIPPTEKAVYLAFYRSGGPASAVEDRFAITPLGGVLRLAPLRIELTSLAKDHFDPGESILLQAVASASAEAQVVQVEFLIDEQPIAVDTEPPYEVTWDGADDGRHVAEARVHDGEGNVALSAPAPFFVGILALERYIGRSEDDAQEGPLGFVRLTSSDLELIEDSGSEQVVGLRFTDIRIPTGAQVAKAYVQFTAEEVSTDPTDLIIQAELTGNGATFRAVTGNLTSRRRTSASVHWSPEAWNERDESSASERTPDLAALIQEVVDRPDWHEGNALVLLISGSDRGERNAWSYDGARENQRLEHAPRLYIELAEPSP